MARPRSDLDMVRRRLQNGGTWWYTSSTAPSNLLCRTASRALPLFAHLTYWPPPQCCCSHWPSPACFFSSREERCHPLSKITTIKLLLLCHWMISPLQLLLAWSPGRLADLPFIASSGSFASVSLFWRPLKTWDSSPLPSILSLLYLDLLHDEHACVFPDELTASCSALAISSEGRKGGPLKLKQWGSLISLGGVSSPLTPISLHLGLLKDEHVCSLPGGLTTSYSALAISSKSMRRTPWVECVSILDETGRTPLSLQSLAISSEDVGCPCHLPLVYCVVIGGSDSSSTSHRNPLTVRRVWRASINEVAAKGPG